MIRRVRRLLARDDGQATVETAFALSTLIAVLMVALGAIAVVATHLAVTDAAGHIARAEARGDEAAAQSARRVISGAHVNVAARADVVEVTVTKRLPLYNVTGRATALLEQ
ncbi:TadE family type IV pilus minor pilin [Corynebacterium sp. NPDC060344]|uniref:TadE family type IV pilus minor pilin n=1 Tax=Corynebacterium sp. NPDC060344 TaxID=3347101 RepID=UPI00364F4786